MSDETSIIGSPDTTLEPKFGLSAEPPPQPSCNLCRHWRGLYNSQAGSCRRHPPQVVGSQEYRWPVTSADSDCGEFAYDVAKARVVSSVVKSSAEDEARMRRVAQELLEKAESGELGGEEHPEFPAVAEASPKIDTTGPAPFVNNPIPKPLKPGVPKHIPVLTVAQMKGFQTRK